MQDLDCKRLHQLKVEWRRRIGHSSDLKVKLDDRWIPFQDLHREKLESEAHVGPVQNLDVVLVFAVRD